MTRRYLLLFGLIATGWALAPLIRRIESDIAGAFNQALQEQRLRGA